MRPQPILLMLRNCETGKSRLVRCSKRRQIAPGKRQHKPENLEPRCLLSVAPIQFGAVYIEQDLGSDRNPDSIEISFIGGAEDTELTQLEINGDSADVTREVLLLARWKAADLYLGDIKVLIDELSMTRCSEALADYTDNAREPYREVLRDLRAMLPMFPEPRHRFIETLIPAAHYTFDHFNAEVSDSGQLRK